MTALGELSGLLGVRVLEVRRVEHRPGSTGVPRRSPNFTAPTPAGWLVRVVSDDRPPPALAGDDGPWVRCLRLSGADLRNPRRLAAWTRPHRPPGDVDRVLSAEDGRQAVRLLWAAVAESAGVRA